MNEKKESIKKLNCAIYTRVSTSEGLQQEFTSLDAQRESAESYVASQKSEGWVVLPEHYDDPGYTGANTERPALQKLISDIKEGKINCVLVNRVDRLSRSLIDFSQLLEFFEQHNVAFVSVTQHFNTKTSMGRLTLNILLSFAQFEREIISERTREKMGAAKRRGAWVGGRPPLGYDLDSVNHKITVNQKEAEIVRLIFDFYLKERSLLAVTKILNERGYRTKFYKAASTGKVFGGVKFKSTTIEYILKNPLYTGKVSYQKELYPGNQERIISDEIFIEVKKLIAENRPARHVKVSNRNTALLKGILRCKACNSAMYDTYNIKQGKRRYHYYVCQNAQKRGYHECPTRLVSAPRMEEKVLEYLRMLCADQRLKADYWDTLILEERINVINSLLKEVSYEGKGEILELILLNSEKRYQFKTSIRELKNLPQLPKDVTIKKEPTIRQYLLLALQIESLLKEDKAKNIKQIARWIHVSRPRLNQLMSLLLLAPKIQEEIICSDNKLIQAIHEYKLRHILMEPDWKKQETLWQNLLKDPSL